MFVVDDHLMNLSSIINPLIKKLSENIPTMSISLFNFQYEFMKTNYPSLLIWPSKTTLFIIIFLNGYSVETKKKIETIGYQIQSLSWREPKPKCLINIFQHGKTLSIKSILKFLWKNEFLDVIIMTKSNEYRTSLAGKKFNQFIVHAINSFARTYSAKPKEITADSEWFPNKLLNLHWQNLRFLIFKTFNCTINHKKIAKISDIVSKGMNCSRKVFYYQGPHANMILPITYYRNWLECSV